MFDVAEFLNCFNMGMGPTVNYFHSAVLELTQNTTLFSFRFLAAHNILVGVLIRVSVLFTACLVFTLIRYPNLHKHTHTHPHT